MRYFNVAGPCRKAEHYMIEASTRLKGVEQLINMKQYFAIHAARQSGKTTYLQDLTQRLNAEGKYYAVYCSLESVQNIVEPEKGIPAIIGQISYALTIYKIPHYENFAKQADFNDYVGVLTMELTKYIELLDKPLVIFFDEADCLSDNTLVSFLRQLRLGYNNRGIAPFIHSVALVGMRNIRDYKAKVRPDSESLGSASPFNIVSKALTLQNFTQEEIALLYQQHTDEIGQHFDEDAIELVFQQTQGQPWLVNAIAREMIFEKLDSDFTQPITAELVEEAIQTIILRRDTHIDSLLERLKEDRVRRVIEPMVTGEDFSERLSDDYQYVCDLGLISDKNGKIKPANPIYAEVITRILTYETQQQLLQDKKCRDFPFYIKDGKIDMNALLGDFQQHWRENSDIWGKKFHYEEAAAQFVFQSFLQRIVNSKGRIMREFATGTKRVDVCVIYNGKKYPIELKIRRGKKTLTEGLEQTLEYMDTLGCNEGWLMLFDQRTNATWDDKIFMKKETFDEKTITVVGL
ncbi:MAG: AAA-like domain-containing protein [Planctomycetaceae bacterium]|jgi:type II secretory pathway predicted ATPase ExeA|nr:AAA-like domain-containing protein [Planctomycetaceae bacterium]